MGGGMTRPFSVAPGTFQTPIFIFHPSPIESFFDPSQAPDSSTTASWMRAIGSSYTVKDHCDQTSVKVRADPFLNRMVWHIDSLTIMVSLQENESIDSKQVYCTL
jgi:hypothetical protein